MQADSLSPQCLWQSRSHIIKRVPISYRTLWAPETVDATLEHSTRYLIWTNLQIRTGNPVLSGILALHEAMTMPLGKLYPPALLPEAKALAHTALSQAETPRPLGYHSCSVSLNTSSAEVQQTWCLCQQAKRRPRSGQDGLDEPYHVLLPWVHLQWVG